MFGVTIVYRESKFSKPERGKLRERERERERERCSVFGVTIVYRESKFSKPERGELRERERERERERDVPCLVLPLSTERANFLNQREVS